jgi:hypothetical protein
MVDSTAVALLSTTMGKWWVKTGDSDSGPFTPKAIGKSVRAGRIRRDAQVRREPTDPWVPLDSVDVLVAALTAPRKRVRAKGSGVDQHQKPPYSEPLFIAAIVASATAGVMRAAGFVGAAIVLFGPPNATKPDEVGPAMFGLGIATLLYLWIVLGMTAHMTRSYKFALALHGVNALIGLVSATRAKQLDLVSLVSIGFASVAFVVTYLARDAFYES